MRRGLRPPRALWILVVGLAAALGSGAGAGGGDRQVVAKIGDRKVTRDEFERQFSRQALPEGADADSARQRFLESMIQKELLVLEARKRGLFQPDSAIDRAVTDFGHDLLRRRVRQEETKVDSTVTEEDIRQAFDLAREEVRMRHIFHWSRAAVDSARQRIDGGEPFAEVAAQVSHHPQTAREGGLFPWLNKLQLIPEFRAVIDTVALGRMAGPFKSVYGWHLVVLEERRPREGADLEVERDELKGEILAQRSRLERFARHEEYQRRYKFEMDEPAIAAVAAEGNIAVTAAAADTTRQGLPLAEIWILSDSTRVLARYEGGAYTAGDYHRLVIREPFFANQRLTPAGGISTIRELFINEARLLESQRLGYDQDPDWRRLVDLKREELVVEKLYAEHVMAGVEATEAEQRAYYEAHPEQFNRSERFRYSYIQVNDAAVAEALMPEMPEFGAAAFDSVVAALQAGGHLVASGRDSGFREATQIGAIAEAARGLKPGEVGHTVEGDSLHTVFVLIHHEPKGQKTFEEARVEVQRTVLTVESEERLLGFLKELERKFAVKRYPDRLANSG